MVERLICRLRGHQWEVLDLRWRDNERPTVDVSGCFRCRLAYDNLTGRTGRWLP